MTRLWHDDVRPAPEGWIWAQNNAVAKTILESGTVTEISMDHDLGGNPADGIFVAGWSPEGSGFDLAKWMVENDRVPVKITIHSWNPSGARRMAQVLTEAGHDVTIEPFQI